MVFEHDALHRTADNGRRRRLLLLLCGVLLAGASTQPAAGQVAAGPVPAGPAAATRGMSVSGAALYKDGIRFYPRGFNSLALVQPDACAAARKSQIPTVAQATWSSSHLSTIMSIWRINTIRFQVSQPGLDPQLDPGHPELLGGQPAYLNRIKSVVATARAKHLFVILSMQEQHYACGYKHPLPSSRTLRAWQALAPAFAGNRYVAFELYNEPDVPATADSWTQWRDGGDTPTANVSRDDGSLYDVVGHQQLVTAVRALGVQNVLIADSVMEGFTLRNLWTSSTQNYLLLDTLSPAQIAYAIHPYAFHVADNSTYATDHSFWQVNFGYVRDRLKIDTAHQFPVISTEWNASATGCCKVGEAKRTPSFLTYLQGLDIGLLAHAVDVPGLLVTAVPGYRPNTFSTGGGECSSGSGAGTVLQAFFSKAP